MPPRNILIKRVLISLAIGLVFGVFISEVPFLFLQETARSPKEIVLTIPKGTSEQVAHGEQPPSIPASMVFVVGDTLVVMNEDNVDHKLGPLWIPANSSAQLTLDQKETLSFECSFQPDKIFGLDVHEPLTFSVRMVGIMSTGLSMGILIALYSIVMPVKKKEDATA